MSIILKAATLAAHYHRAQKRDSNGRPYETHLCRVAGRTATRKGMTEYEVAGAFLHDILEDQTPTPELYEEIKNLILTECGPETFAIVLDLTNPSKGSKLPRAERKRIDREHLAKQSRNVKIIKLIDRIDNVNEFKTDTQIGLECRFDFLLRYCDESTALLKEALAGADTELEAELLRSICLLRMEAEFQKEEHKRS